MEGLILERMENSRTPPEPPVLELTRRETAWIARNHATEGMDTNQPIAWLQSQPRISRPD